MSLSLMGYIGPIIKISKNVIYKGNKYDFKLKELYKIDPELEDLTEYFQNINENYTGASPVLILTSYDKKINDISKYTMEIGNLYNICSFNLDSKEIEKKKSAFEQDKLYQKILDALKRNFGEEILKVEYGLSTYY